MGGSWSRQKWYSSSKRAWRGADPGEISAARDSGSDGAMHTLRRFPEFSPSVYSMRRESPALSRYRRGESAAGLQLQHQRSQERLGIGDDADGLRRAAVAQLGHGGG